MYRVKIFFDKPTKESWLQLALAEYEKRLKGKARIEWIPDLTLSLQEKKLIALDIQGEMLDSIALSKKLLSFGSTLSFVIGGPDGLPPSILKQAVWKLSFSPLTFTNQMVRLILIEQIYRSLEIDRGSPYHK